jgi:hypothetical protein
VTVSETLDSNSILIWLIAQENVTEKGIKFPVSAIWYHLCDVQAERNFPKIYFAVLFDAVK